MENSATRIVLFPLFTHSDANLHGFGDFFPGLTSAILPQIHFARLHRNKGLFSSFTDKPRKFYLHRFLVNLRWFP